MEPQPSTPSAATRTSTAEDVGLSEIWWRQIETGRTTQVPADTLARMFIPCWVAVVLNEVASV
jgi:hypothetical protein